MYTEKLGNTEQLHNKAHNTNVKITVFALVIACIM